MPCAHTPGPTCRMCPAEPPPGPFVSSCLAHALCTVSQSVSADSVHSPLSSQFLRAAPRRACRDRSDTHHIRSYISQYSIIQHTQAHQHARHALLSCTKGDHEPSPHADAPHTRHQSSRAHARPSHPCLASIPREVEGAARPERFARARGESCPRRARKMPLSLDSLHLRGPMSPRSVTRLPYLCCAATRPPAPSSSHLVRAAMPCLRALTGALGAWRRKQGVRNRVRHSSSIIVSAGSATAAKTSSHPLSAAACVSPPPVLAHRLLAPRGACCSPTRMAPALARCARRRPLGRGARTVSAIHPPSICQARPLS